MNVQELLATLKRPDVVELALAGGFPPMVNVGGRFVPAAGASIPPELIREACKTLGGEPHLASLGASPVSWQTRVDGQMVAVHAVVQQNQLQVRVQVQRAPNTTPPSTPVPPAAGKPSTTLPPQPRPGTPAPSTPVPSSTGKPSTTLPPQPRPAPTLPVPPNGFTTLDELLTAARASWASDLHVVADRPALLRVAGELLPAGGPLSAAVVEKMLTPIVPASLRAVLEKDGAADFSLQHATLGRYRANVSRQRTGMKGSFRVIPTEIPTLASLGLPEQIAQALHHHQGLIVITGASGHGKTTTLAAILDIINSTTAHHVITVEDPVEFVHPRKKALMSQREVGTHTRTFASALKGSLREDPDVIMVGELRDTETVRMALSASETGHLVLGTMNTPSAAKTIDRLIDLFPPADQPQVRTTLAGGLRLIVSQKLVPNIDGTRMVAAAEVLPGNTPLWNMIRENKTYQIPSLQQRGKALGIVRLEDTLAELAKAGKISIDTARNATDAPDEVEALITGKRKSAEPPPTAPQQSVLQKASGLFKKGS